jgi:hypothetical protein
MKKINLSLFPYIESFIVANNPDQLYSRYKFLIINDSRIRNLQPERIKRNFVYNFKRKNNDFLALIRSYIYLISLLQLEYSIFKKYIYDIDYKNLKWGEELVNIYEFNRRTDQEKKFIFNAIEENIFYKSYLDNGNIEFPGVAYSEKKPIIKNYAQSESISFEVSND